MGPFATGAMLGDLTGQAGTNLRITVGARLNLVGWAAIFGGPLVMGGIMR